METNNTSGEILLNVNFDNLLLELQELTTEYQKNAATLKKLKEMGKENTTQAIELKNAQSVLKGEMRGVEKQIQNEIKAQKAYDGSLVQMRAQLANLNKQYDSMSGMERMGEQGVALQQKIKALSSEIQGLEENTGRWQRNVGNYKSALEGLKTSFEGAGLASGGLDRAMKLLSGNPWMTALKVLFAILVPLITRLRQSKEMTDALGRAMDGVKPILDIVSKLISKLAGLLANVLDWALQKVIESIGWLGRKLQQLGKVFGKDWGGALITASDSMLGVKEATDEAAESTDNFATSTNNAAKAVENTREKLEDFADTYKRLLDEMKKESLADVLQKAGGTKTAEEVLADMEEGYEKIEKVLEDMPTELPESMKPSAFEKFTAGFLNNAQTIEGVASQLSSSFGSLGSIYSQMAEDETKSEKERAAAAKKAKLWSAMQIAANSGTAIAKGVAQAMDTPFPANLVAITTTMAAVLSAIAQAKALAAEGFETGGVIGGYQGASMGHDNTVINARQGEMVLNANQQRRLFDIANGTATSSLTASLVAALQSMPAPVMDFQEFTRFSSRVSSINENSKLK